MKAFFKKMEVRKHERLEKESLTNELKSRVEDALLGRTEEDGLYVTNDEAGISLCTVLEAIFVHGTKESLTDKMVSALGDPDVKPTPEFWSPMMVFTHKNIIQQITQMKQINTDVGRSRAWLRLALNDNSILAYLELIAKQNRALFRFYKKTAYLRDIEAIGISISILQGLSKFAFNFPVNSTILNYWPNAPLLLAGLWTPPMKYSPISTGLDLAKNLQASSEVETGTELFGYDIPSTSMSTMLHEEAMEILLNTPVAGSPLMSRCESEKSDSAIDSENYQSSDEASPSRASPKPELNAIPESIVQETVLVETPERALTPDITNESYEKIIDGYNPKSNEIFQEGLKEFIDSAEISPEKTNQPEINEMGFEVVDKTALPLNKEDMRTFLKILLKGEICQEVGLDSQQFACRKCGIVIGLSPKKPKVCAFTGFYYCEECYNGIEMAIPARILHNWDFKKYSISESSFSFMIDVMEHPLLNIKKINPKIYFTIEDMNQVRKLRVKLNLLRPYLASCREPINSIVRKLLWPKDYLFEHVHAFSASDLFEMETGKLVQDLKKVIQMSVEHIKNCELCIQKGFICELCPEDSPQLPIFPFDDDIHRCQVCNNVVHLKCYKKIKECRRCIRRKGHKAKLERHKSVENS